MTVQVILEFTDAQWPLVKEHFACYSDVLDEHQHFIGKKQDVVTPEILSAHLMKYVQDDVVNCMKQKIREEQVSGLDNAFNV